MKKLLSLGLIGVLSASLMVGCSDDTKDKDENNNTKQEQKTFKEETITDNEYIKMILIGKEKNEYGAIALKILIENKTDNRLLVSTENIQVNGVMNDPYWSCTVNAKAQAYSFIEWYPDNDLNTNVKAIDDLKDINGDLEIGNAIPNTTNEYETVFKTQISILSKDTSTKESTDDNEVVAEKPSPKKTTANISDEESEQATSKSDNKITQTVTKDTSQKETTQEKSASKEKTTTKNEEPKQKGYWVTCPNGHKVYTENGDYDCGQCYDDYMNQQEGNEDNNDDDNIDDETGLAKVKDGTHLGEMNPDDDIEAIEDPEYYE